jgi:DNA-binding response OmpR family regulator
MRLPSPLMATPGKLARILFVDDEPALRFLCRLSLEAAGFEVAEAEDGTQALALASSQPFDLVLLDVMLPDLDGFEVAETLRKDERTSALPVAFVSARVGNEDLRRGYETGGVDYISKPFDPAVLGERVSTILERLARGESDEYRQARLAELSDR